MLCSALQRELQALADQEKISPEAIKKTTLDKVLQQPGVTTGVGVRPRGINMFNTSRPKKQEMIVLFLFYFNVASKNTKTAVTTVMINCELASVYNRLVAVSNYRHIF